MRYTAAGLWKWSPVITLPITILFAYWVFATTSRYATFGIRYDSRPMPASLYNIGKMELRHALTRLRHTFHIRGAAEIAGLPTVDLFMDERAETTLNQSLPHSGMSYVKAHLVYPDTSVRPVKVKYRGDYSQHWAHFKKSTRIKTKKAHLFKGQRAFNLIAPKFEEMLNNHLSYLLAEELGLPAPESDMVLYRVNGRNRGIHLMVEQPEELTLRRNRRMPGDLYKGELVGKDNYKGVSANVFENPGLWEKIAINNHYDEKALDPLYTLTETLADAPDDNGAHARAMELLEPEVWGRFALFELLTQCFHFDIGHNWRLYYDPYKGYMEPLIWDPVGWHPSWRPRKGDVPSLDINLSPLHHTLLSDYPFLTARHRAAAEFFETGRDAAFLATLDHWIARMKKAVAADPHITSHFKFFSAGEARKAMDALRTNVHKTFEAVRRGMLEDPGSLRYAIAGEGRIAVEVNGRRPLDYLELVYAEPPERLPMVHIVTRFGDREVVTDISGVASLKGPVLGLDIPLTARFSHQNQPERGSLKAKSLRVEPAWYEIRVDGVNAELLGLNAERGGPVEATRVDVLEPIPFTEGKRIVTPRPLNPPEIWSGRVTIEKDRVIESGRVVIRPGTRVQLAAGVSLIIKGNLVAEGTAQAPIVFESLDTEPWGVLALQGHGADKSRLSHCIFRGGSGYKQPLTEYSAMFSVHHADHVVVRDCTFDTSHQVDDMVHTVYADIRFERCRFLNALSDAVDLDISRAYVIDCLFENSGNDGLDLMSSRVVVQNSHFINNGDKGISVGEGTDLVAFNNRFQGNVFGVQAKDGSRARLANSAFMQNKHALDAYKKNWRYAAGGRLTVTKSTFRDNREPSGADKHSIIQIHDSYLPETERGKNLSLHASVDGIHENTAATKDLPRFNQATDKLPDLLTRAWQQVNPDIRGTHDTAHPPSF
ncbi:MAG: CotH kinase family protein [Acidobacteriota bacterium]|nr:CotH kinase family protein [Acidobacteriota bacterium]